MGGGRRFGCSCFGLFRFTLLTLPLFLDIVGL